MYSKNKVKVMKKIIENREGHIIEPVNFLHKQLPELDKRKISAILSDLLNDEFIYTERQQQGLNVLPGGTRTYEDTFPITETEKHHLLFQRIEINYDKIIVYLDKKQEQQYDQIKKWLWDTFKWLFPFLIGWFLKTLTN